MKTTSVKCETCGKLFEKANSEIARCKKNHVGNYCSRTCVAVYRNKSRPQSYWKAQYKKHPILKKYANNRLNELSPFKTFLKTGKASVIKHKDDIDIDPLYLKILWEQQAGICPYTGIKMILPKSSSKHHAVKSLKKASLDRIDSSLGYRKGNVEFVCLAINLAKNNHSKNDMAKFIREIITRSKS